MFSLKGKIYIASALTLCALSACSSDNPSSAGSTTIPNAIAENSSSSEELVSSSSIEQSSNSSIVEKDIFFATAATSTKKIAQGEVTVYGKENGAQASCSAGKSTNKKLYEAKISITSEFTMERTLLLRNFGNACDSLFNAFKESCPSEFMQVAADMSCNNEKGNLKVFCYASKSASDMICDATGRCTLAKDTASLDFDAIVDDFSKESDDICSGIADGVDTTSYELPPAGTDSGVVASSKRRFIIEPNTENQDISEEERVFLDSLAAAFPQKTRIDQIDGMTIFINYDAEYKFTTAKETYNDRASNCNVNVYKEESGLVRFVDGADYWMGMSATTLMVSDSAIIYLARGEIGSAVNPVKEAFQAECEATSGSFYDYYPHEGKLAVGCAVKNFTDIPFKTVAGEQRTLCNNEYLETEKIILD